MDWDFIIDIAKIVIPALVMWFAKSPIAKDVPKQVTEVLARLTPSAIDEMYEALATKQQRRETAIEYVQRVAARYGIDVDYYVASMLVDYLTKVYKKVRK